MRMTFRHWKQSSPIILEKRESHEVGLLSPNLCMEHFPQLCSREASPVESRNLRGGVSRLGFEAAEAAGTGGAGYSK